MLAGLSSCGKTDGRKNARLHSEDSIYAISYADELYNIKIDSPQCFIYDVANDILVFSKGEDKVVYPGSTSKLITALFTLSVLSAEMVITAGDELDMVKPGSSIAYIKKGHMLTVEMLIQAMMMPSGNDAAYVLSAAVGRAIRNDDGMSAQDAVSAFIEDINAYCLQIGLCGTVITTPDGYAGDEQYTTTEDMAIVAKLACQNEIISEYASLAKANVVYASGHTNTWINTNKLLDPESAYYSPYVKGLKTGSISGEYSLVFCFEFDDGRKYIAGLFGADNKNARFKDANTIISYFEEAIFT